MCLMAWLPRPINLSGFKRTELLQCVIWAPVGMLLDGMLETFFQRSSHFLATAIASTDSNQTRVQLPNYLNIAFLFILSVFEFCS